MERGLFRFFILLIFFGGGGEGRLSPMLSKDRYKWNLIFTRSADIYT